MHKEDRERFFYRPLWMVYANLVGAVLFSIASAVNMMGQRMFLSLFLLILAVFWLRRFLWARQFPFLEVTEEALKMYVSAVREMVLPWEEVESVEGSDSAIRFKMKDGSKLRFSKSDFRPGELPRLIALVRKCVQS